MAFSAADQTATAVKITTKTHVKPTTNKLIGRKECQLVTFDLPYLAFYYNQKLLIYKSNGSDQSFADVAGKMKESLGVVLEEFYQLAGKLGKDEEGVFRVEYDDSDADVEGVEVLEGVAEGVCVDDLTVEDGSVGALLSKELIPYNGVLNLEGMHRPLLAVQLTKLKDGIAMGCAFNHAILDGTSTWHFMSTWADICSGKCSSVSNPPFLERTKARNTRVKLDLSPPAPATKANGEEESAAAAAKSEGPELREKVFKFTDAEVATIKSLVNSKPPLSEGSKPLSTFQTLSVHIWRHVTMARELKPEDYTVFTVFADCSGWTRRCRTATSAT
ncbi:BAHD acyltransferase DCR [Linum grandiflorum]